jgi:hypothetical protein
MKSGSRRGSSRVALYAPVDLGTDLALGHP